MTDARAYARGLPALLVDLPTRKLNRLAARRPLQDREFWCGCDTSLVRAGQRCKQCRTRAGVRPAKPRDYR